MNFEPVDEKIWQAWIEKGIRSDREFARRARPVVAGVIILGMIALAARLAG